MFISAIRTLLYSLFVVVLDTVSDEADVMMSCLGVCVILRLNDVILQVAAY